jgi:hypothetical protein
MVDLSPPHLPRHHKAGPANHGRTVADEVNIDFPQQSGNALLAESGKALVFGRLHDKPSSEDRSRALTILLEGRVDA